VLDEVKASMQKFRDVRFEDECADDPTRRAEVHVETNLVVEQRAARAGRKLVIVLKPLETACDHTVPKIKGWFEVINLGDVIIPKAELHTLPADVVAGLHQTGDTAFHGRHVQLTMNYFDACRERKAAGNWSLDDQAVADDEHDTELDAPERPSLCVWKDSLWVCAVSPLLRCHLHLTTQGFTHVA
jgi:hypothetical protein